MEKEIAEQFAKQWTNSWNNHNLEAIMEHYADSVDFNSPFIRELGIDENGNINNKTELRKYFEKALQKHPELHFDLIHVLAGSHSLVMFYKRLNKSYAGEFVELNENGKVIRSRSHYTSAFNLNDFIHTWAKSWTSSCRENPEELLLSFYTEDCFYADPRARAGIIGKENLRTYFKKLLLHNPEWIWEMEEIIPTAKGCVVRWKATLPVKNEQVIEKGLDIIEIENGLISRNEAFFDRYEWITKLNNQ